MSSAAISSSSTSTSTATPACISVTPDKNGYVPEWACNSNYNYYPSFAAALVFAVIFGITTFIHIYQAFAYKKLRISWVIIMGAAWEFASFALRVAGTKNQQSTPIAFVSQILVLLAPMWVNAFDYMVMGRMIYFFVPEKRIWGIKGSKIAEVFVWLDILSFFTQVGGGVMISPGASQSTLMTGIHIYMGGIGLQELCILIFTSIVTKFFLVMRNKSRMSPAQATKSSTASLANGGYCWIDPSKNPIPYHEAYFMALDALPMFIAIVLMNLVHPGRILKGEGSEFPKGPTRKEKKEAKRIKKEEKRTAKEEKKSLKWGNKTRNKMELAEAI